MGILAQKIKQKYPEYINVPDSELESRVVAKYPGYARYASEQQSPGLFQQVGNFIAPKLTEVANVSGDTLGMVGDYIAYHNANTPEDRMKAAIAYNEKKDRTSNFFSKAGFGTSSNPGFDPIKFAKSTAQPALEAASFMVPVGKGLPSVLKNGALSGAFQGASSMNSASDIPNIFTSALGGALGNGLMHGVSSAANKFSDFLSKNLPTLGEKMNNTINNATGRVYVDSSVNGAAKEAKIMQTLKDLGIVGGPQAKYEKLQPAMQKLNSDIASIIENNPKSASLDEIASIFKSKLDSSLRTKDLSNKQAITEVAGYLQDLMKSSGVGHQFLEDGVNKAANPMSLSSSELFKLKKLANSDYQGVIKKIQSNSPLNPREKVIAAGRDTLDEMITKLHPDIKDRTIMQSHLYDAAESFGAQRKTIPTQRVFGWTVPGFIKDKVMELSSAAGNTAENGQRIVNNVTNSALSKIQPVRNVFSQLVPSGTTNRVGRSMFSRSFVPSENLTNKTKYNDESPESNIQYNYQGNQVNSQSYQHPTSIPSPTQNTYQDSLQKQQEAEKKRQYNIWQDSLKPVPLNQDQLNLRKKLGLSYQ